MSFFLFQSSNNFHFCLCCLHEIKYAFTRKSVYVFSDFQFWVIVTKHFKIECMSCCLLYLDQDFFVLLLYIKFLLVVRKPSQKKNIILLHNLILQNRSSHESTRRYTQYSSPSQLNFFAGLEFPFLRFNSPCRHGSYVWQCFRSVVVFLQHGAAATSVAVSTKTNFTSTMAQPTQHVDYSNIRFCAIVSKPGTV